MSILSLLQTLLVTFSSHQHQKLLRVALMLVAVQVQTATTQSKGQVLD